MKNNLLLAAMSLLLIAFVSSCGVKKKYMHNAFDMLKAEFPNAKTKLDGNKIQLIFPNNDMFDVGSSTLKPKFEDRVTRLAKIMNKFPDTKMDIIGHTDNTGGTDLNKKLSDDRSLHVLESLRDHGVKATRLTSHGEGETMPIADNSTDAGKAENRRVEFEMTYNK
jgi:outer membrane protein OmpA-like peptidoglycan-associated protein